MASYENMAAIISNNNTKPWMKPQEAEDWLELSGKKLMRYYYKTQGPNKFKMRKVQSKKSKKDRPLGTGSNDCPPMINPEEIKITLFEYPKDGNYKPQRPVIRHIQSINPYLTATNMLEALKSVIEAPQQENSHQLQNNPVTPSFPPLPSFPPPLYGNHIHDKIADSSKVSSDSAGFLKGVQPSRASELSSANKNSDYSSEVSDLSTEQARKEHLKHIRQFIPEHMRQFNPDTFKPHTT